jgi:hypothetical protein
MPAWHSDCQDPYGWTETLTKNKAVGLKVEIDLLYPDEVIAGDEVGCNTNAKDKDRNKQRKTFSLKTLGKTVLGHSNFDVHFTLFPLRTLSGEVVQHSLQCCPSSPLARLWARPLEIRRAVEGSD